MISCTEFIPAYSELFSYLEAHYGKEEVDRLWTYLFKPKDKGLPLIKYAKKDGLRGCWNYWVKTLTEEAADTLRYFNEEKGWIFSQMRYCPSKGRLLRLEKEIGLKPYYDYCGHCDCYRASLESVGLRYIRIHTHVDEAQCTSVIYDPKKFKGICVTDENTEVLDLKPGEHEYFHPGFHRGLNSGVHFLAEEHGLDALKEYLTDYTKHVLVKTIEAMKEDPLGAIAANIAQTYRQEKAEDALEMVNDGKSLSVKITYCPAVKFLHDSDREPSPWFRYTTETVMQTLADAGDLQFVMDFYDEETGAAKYTFTKKG